MKRFLLAAAVAVAAIATPVHATDVGVTVSIGQPGFYGRLDIGGYPPPQVIYRQPVIIEIGPYERPPIYLRVPPGHAKHWSKNCYKYNACGERVYFVKDDWYSREYAPRYQEKHRDRRDDYRDKRGDDRRGKQKHDRQDKDKDNNKDYGRGRDR
ncbi:MAG: hypothetical protein QMD17_03690 [Rhodocyclaceae bacterium]|jgi:hypothetical protein|nr:hypothetical protein [Rhodocyclaceae bacterium]